MTAQDDKKPTPKLIEIEIDHVKFRVPKGTITEAGLRALPEPDVAADRDIWEDRPGSRDRKILAGETVELHDGQRFFTTPGRINPGAPRRSF